MSSVMTSVMGTIHSERKRLMKEIHELDRVSQAIERTHGTRYKVKTKRILSAAGRRRISIAQKARWAKIRTVKMRK